jgi:hypothetical protein
VLEDGHKQACWQIRDASLLVLQGHTQRFLMTLSQGMGRNTQCSRPLRRQQQCSSAAKYGSADLNEPHLSLIHGEVLAARKQGDT